MATVAVSIFTAGGAAHAHEFVCEKSVALVIPGQTTTPQSLLEIDDYPSTLEYEVLVRNVHPTSPSEALEVFDSLYAFPIASSFTLAVGASLSAKYNITIESYDDCLRLAGVYQSKDRVSVDNTFYVRWELGDTVCTARVVCIAPPPPCRECEPPPPPPPPGGGATRTMGFFKTHEQALNQCVTGLGDIALGDVHITSLVQALGLLWGSPSQFDDGTTRAGYDHTWFLLARQTLVAICNQYLFGTSPTPSSLIDDALAALAGTACGDIQGLVGDVDQFNNSGDEVGFPAGFTPGPATPRHARSIADDPTTPSGLSCQ